MAKKSIFESKLLKTKVKSSSVKLFPEAALGFFLGPVLALMCNAVLNIWLIQYWDKVLGLSEWARTFEILLPIFSAILIIIGNIIVGRIMERKPSFAGKARPLILLGMPIIAVALLIMFLVPFPGFFAEPHPTFSPNTLTLVFVAIGYNLFYAISWPIYYTSHSALVNLSTRDSGKRGLLSTFIMGAQLAASGLAGMAGGVLVDLIGLLPVYEYNLNGEVLTGNSIPDGATYISTKISPAECNNKWTILMIILVVALVLGSLLEYFFTRERITEEKITIERSGKNEQIKEIKKVSMKEQMKICFHDKYWWLIIVFYFLYQFGGQMKNNSMSFYSQSMTGQNSLSSLINTVGAIPTALGMVIVWPIARKISKSKTIVLGSFLALLGGGIAFAALIPGLNNVAVDGIAVGSFIVKALGTAPAMYIGLSVLALILDHQEAVHGVRTDGFTMAVYGSIMVAMAGICNGIIVGINSLSNNQETLKLINTILAYGVEAVCYLAMGIMFLFMNVEKFTRVDNKVIHADQKAKVLAEGGTWIEPEERAKLEEEENKRIVEEQRVAELKAICVKKGLDFEVENKKHLDKVALIDKEKQAKADEAKAKKAQKEAMLTEEQKKAIEVKKAKLEEKKAKNDEEALKELNALRVKNGKPAV